MTFLELFQIHPAGVAESRSSPAACPGDAHRSPALRDTPDAGSCATTTELRPVTRTAIIAASAAAVEPSYMEAFATSMPVSSQIMVWNSKIACSVPCEISA